MAAAGGLMQELPAALKSSRPVGEIIPAILQDAENMGIKLTPGSKGGRVLSWIENYLRTHPATSGFINQTIDKETNQSILQFVHRMDSGIRRFTDAPDLIPQTN